MADLLDIAPSTAVEVVKIDGTRIKVRGVSVDAIASIVARFPEVKSLVNGGVGDSLVPALDRGLRRRGRADHRGRLRASRRRDLRAARGQAVARASVEIS